MYIIIACARQDCAVEVDGDGGGGLWLPQTLLYPMGELCCSEVEGAVSSHCRTQGWLHQQC